MGDIGLFVSSFGGMGLFIWYLLNKDRTTSKEQTDAIKDVAKKLDEQTEALDDNSFLFLDLLDNFIDGYREKRNIETLQTRIEDRQYGRKQRNIQGTR